MADFHRDRQKYFNLTFSVTRDHIYPLVSKHLPADRPWKVLEIGSGFGGVLKAFTDHGHDCTGIELYAYRVEIAEGMMQEELEKGLVRFISRDIYEVDPAAEPDFKFDLIILKDVIEHIHGQERFIPRLKGLLEPGGKVFFAFPPWQMPFGGHQQIARSKLAKMPYIHLLPKGLYRGLLQALGEPENVVAELLDIKECGISIERFERLMKQNDFEIIVRDHYLFNPIYEYKFKLRPRRQSPLISAIPWLRNFLTTGVYYLVGAES